MKAGISVQQIEVLCTFFEENPEVIKGYKKTSAGIDAVQTKWKRITPQLNSLGEERHHKSWAKYLCNVKAKLKRKRIKWKQNSDGSGPIICNANDFSELELRMLQVLRRNAPSISADHNTSDMEEKDDESISDTGENSWQDKTIPVEKNVHNNTHIKLLDDNQLLGIQSHVYNNNSVIDEFDSFGQNVSHQLRTLPLTVALETQEMLLSVLRKQRLKVLKTNENALKSN